MSPAHVAQLYTAVKRQGNLDAAAGGISNRYTVQNVTHTTFWCQRLCCYATVVPQMATLLCGKKMSTRTAVLQQQPQVLQAAGLHRYCAAAPPTLQTLPALSYAGPDALKRPCILIKYPSFDMV